MSEQEYDDHPLEGRRRRKRRRWPGCLAALVAVCAAFLPYGYVVGLVVGGEQVRAPQPLELVRPLMESLEHDLLPRDAPRRVLRLAGGAHEDRSVREDDRRLARPHARHRVEVRRLDLAPLEAVAVAALLVRGDEQNVRFAWHSY